MSVLLSFLYNFLDTSNPISCGLFLQRSSNKMKCNMIQLFYLIFLDQFVTIGQLVMTDPLVMIDQLVTIDPLVTIGQLVMIGPLVTTVETATEVGDHL